MNHEEMTCSLRECGKPLLGMCVLVRDYDPFEGTLDFAEQFEAYVTQDAGGFNNLAILHPACWDKVFAELQKQESMTALMVIVGGVQDIREGLQIP